MDRRLVAGLPEEDAVVSMVATIAEIVALNVVADGVKTQRQRDGLLARGITVGQGSFYSESRPINSFTERFFTHADQRITALTPVTKLSKHRKNLKLK